MGRRGWLTVAGKALLFLALALCLTEMVWRILGYAPKMSDKLYFAQIRRAARNDSRAVALVGSSRVRHGLDPVTLSRTVPGRHFLELATDGQSALPGLYDLARDPEFRGLVVCEFNPAHWSREITFSRMPDVIAYSHPEVSGEYLEMWLDEHVRQHFSFFSYNLLNEVPNRLQHKLRKAEERVDRFVPRPDPGPAVNRNLVGRWSRVARDQAKVLGDSAAEHVPQAVQQWIGQIRGRGGDVAFVRMPVDGALRSVEEQVFPHGPGLMRDLRARGLLVVDFADMPEHFYCPDGSHLEAPYAFRFSRRTGEELAAKGFFR